MKLLAQLCSAVLVAALPRWAGATPNFPAEIQAHLALGSAPPCGVCHANGQTGLGTVTTPFGITLKANGLVPYDLPSLDAALNAISASMVSSVGDGIADVQKLRAGEDPNVALGADGGAVASSFSGYPPPDYGCGMGGAGGGSPGLLAAAGLLLAVRRRRRTTRCSSPAFT